MIIHKSLLLEMLNDLQAYYDGDCIVESDCARDTTKQKESIKTMKEVIEKNTFFHGWVRIEEDSG